MASDLGTARPQDGSRTAAQFAVSVAVVVLVLFRVEVLPGGIAGWDLLFAVAGWFLAGSVRTAAQLRAAVTRAFAVVWPAAAAAVVVAVAWVLTVGGTGLDATVRGQAFGLFDGLGNWHLLSRGPLEGRDPLATPLQALWVTSAFVQVALAWVALFLVTRRRAVTKAATEPGSDPMLLASLAALAGLVVWAVVLVASGSSGQRLLVGPELRAIALFGGSAAAYAMSTKAAPTVRSVVGGVLPLVGGLFLVVSVVASPDSGLYRHGGAVAVPIAAALVVVGLFTRPPAPVAALAARVGALVDRLGAKVGGSFGSVVVAFLVLHGPVVSLLVGDRDGVVSWVARLAGIPLALVASVVVSRLAARRASTAVAVERRRVIVPPAVAAIVVLLMSVTGAFHWSSPHLIEPPSAGASSHGG